VSKQYTKKAGFTLPELLIATLVFTISFAGILLGFLRCMELNELARHTSTAVNAVKSQIATIENTSFNQILANYNNATFSATDLNGIGVSYINSLDTDLLEVTITFCWQEKNGRVIGEDANLNGQLDAGEDQNSNGILDSPVKLTTSVYNT